jgi:fucose 4-O-acetylase-like acetyltransferase
MVTKNASSLSSRLDELASSTPASRDRYVDFLRAFSILSVVGGHWFISLNYWRNGVIGSTSAIGVTPWLWLATWIFQVMPLFFFVGGFSNLATYNSFRRRGLSTLAFLRTRFARLLKPSLVLVGVWTVIQIVLHLADIGGRTTWFLRGMRPPGATIPFGPLWFLAVYFAVVAVSPLTIWLHRRFGVGVVVAMAAGVVGADALGFIGGRHGFRWVNAALVWLLPHQLGYLYADGRLARLSRRALAAMALGGLATLTLLTNPIFGEAGQRWFPGIGHYPKSLLGTDVEPIANTYPPTICLAAMGVWSVGVVMLLRDRVSRWLQRPRPWKGVIAVNSVIMTLFLWHMTAYLLALLVLWPMGFGREADSTVRWWLERPLWIIVPGVFLVGLMAVFGRFERPARLPQAPVPSGG